MVFMMMIRMFYGVHDDDRMFYGVHDDDLCDLFLSRHHLKSMPNIPDSVESQALPRFTSGCPRRTRMNGVWLLDEGNKNIKQAAAAAAATAAASPAITCVWLPSAM